MNLKNNILFIFFLMVASFITLAWWEIYVPKSYAKSQPIVYSARKGMGDEEIAKELEDKGIIKSRLFFEFYAVMSGNHSNLQAGKYELSSSMSSAEILKKFMIGDTVKDKITIVEGWNVNEIAKYLEIKKGYAKEDFLNLAKQDFSEGFAFLKDKPQNMNLEGYIFPDTYETFDGQTAEEILRHILANFDKKLTIDVRNEIALQKKSIFEIITMSSIIEKEVRSSEDKKIVSGILWKRIEAGIPLQVDSTVNYITNKNDARVAIKDTKIDSPYNTYKYYGLPKGPISNPGQDSILAAVYPEESNYWYYLSAKDDGKTIFSKTLDEHNIAVAKYLK